MIMLSRKYQKINTNIIEISLYKITNDTVDFLCTAVVIRSGVQFKIRNIFCIHSLKT